MKGPYDPNNSHRSNTTKSRVRSWEKFDNLSRMADVGRKGRLKFRAALEKQAMEIEHTEEDWFADAKKLVFPHRNYTRRPRESLLTDKNDQNVPERWL